LTETKMQIKNAEAFKTITNEMENGTATIRIGTVPPF